MLHRLFVERICKGMGDRWQCFQVGIRSWNWWIFDITLYYSSPKCNHSDITLNYKVAKSNKYLTKDIHLLLIEL